MHPRCIHPTARAAQEPKQMVRIRNTGILRQKNTDWNLKTARRKAMGHRLKFPARILQPKTIIINYLQPTE